jgi:protein-disulfide isomerase
MRLSDLALVGCLALASVGAVGACASDPSAASQAPAPQANPDTVVAEIGGRKVTLQELDAKWEEFDAAERARVTQMLYQNRRNMLDQLVGDIVIENAAKAANLSVDDFVKQDAAKRQTPVSEAEIAQFYEQNKDRAQGRTLDQLRQQIKDFLESQRRLQARAQLIEELKGKTSGGVKVLLEPPRYTVAVKDTDPVRGNAAAPVTLVEFSDYQ